MAENGGAVPRTVVELVTEDQPFLVDSVAASLANAGHAVLFRVHPAVEVLRGRDGQRNDLLDQQSQVPGRIREAVIHLELRGVASPQRAKEIKRLIRDVVSDIRSAVEDWRPMLDVLDRTIDEIKRSVPPLSKEVVAESIACRQHKSLDGISPAMAAGVTGRLWDIEDIVRLVDEAAAKPAPRGPYKKRISN